MPPDLWGRGSLLESPTVKWSQMLKWSQIYANAANHSLRLWGLCSPHLPRVIWASRGCSHYQAQCFFKSRVHMVFTLRLDPVAPRRRCRQMCVASAGIRQSHQRGQLTWSAANCIRKYRIHEYREPPCNYLEVLLNIFWLDMHCTVSQSEGFQSINTTSCAVALITFLWTVLYCPKCC